MGEFKKAVKKTEISSGSGKAVVLNGTSVAIFNVDGNFHAIDNTCLHQGGPLGEGDLDGHVVTCPWHGWQFDVRNGQHQASTSLRHISFPVKVEGDEILVDVDA